MTLTEEEFETLWGNQKAVLSDLFNKRVHPKTAAQKLAAIVLPQPPPDHDDEDEDNNTMAYIEGMWILMIHGLEESPERAKPVSDLIVCVSQLRPAITQTGKQLCEDNRRVWQDVPRLEMALRDEWSAILAQRGGAEITRFIGVNALIGHLMLRDMKLFRYDLFALWTIRDALEHPLSESGPAQKNVKSQRELSLCSIPAAVTLVEILGELMYSWDHEFEHSPLKAPGGGGPLWNGKHGFCKERWNLWHERFAELSSDCGLEGTYRNGARKAADVMSAIEKGV